MPGGTGNGTDNNGIWTTAIGQCFVDALNEGLTRSVASRAYALPGQHVGGVELPDPYAAAVLRRFEDDLQTVLAPEDRHDATVRSAVKRRARQLLRDAFGLAEPPRRSLPSDADTELPTRHEAVVTSLLLECAVLVVLEQGTFEGSRRRPADLVRALGRSVRHPAPTGERDGLPAPRSSHVLEAKGLSDFSHDQ
ncbi:hypothetical protein [Streptomyces cavernae]|uniref:hypothetical protein n=1 Tax=Streptomyces cavernae TaxID=2259034 RepID=UPI00192E731E|nr:hypothetical protein [Streptomyces cavernae]